MIDDKDLKLVSEYIASLRRCNVGEDVLVRNGAVIKDFLEYKASAATTTPRTKGICPTCQADVKITERRPNGDSWCINGHKHKTKDFYPLITITTKGAL